MRDYFINLLGGVTQAQTIELIEGTIQEIAMAQAKEPFIMKEFVGFNELAKSRKEAKNG